MSSCGLLFRPPLRSRYRLSGELGAFSSHPCHWPVPEGRPQARSAQHLSVTTSTRRNRQNKVTAPFIETYNLFYAVLITVHQHGGRGSVWKVSYYLSRNTFHELDGRVPSSNLSPRTHNAVACGATVHVKKSQHPLSTSAAFCDLMDEVPASHMQHF